MIKQEEEKTSLDLLLKLLEQRDCGEAQRLIQEGFDINQKNKYGFTALHIVVVAGSIYAAKALLELGADPNISVLDAETEVDVTDVPHSLPEESVTLALIQEIQSLQYATPLQIAICKNKEEIVTLLLDYKADPNIKDVGGCTPLHWAATKGNENLVNLLLNHYVDANAVDVALSTPLHETVRRNYFSIAKRLLEAGADPMLKDITGTTPLDLAKRINNNLYLYLLDVVNKSPNDSIH